MTGSNEHNPTSWGVVGNIISKNIGEPTSLTPFSPSDCSLALLDPAVIDGETLIPLKVEPDWPV